MLRQEFVKEDKGDGDGCDPTDEKKEGDKQPTGIAQRVVIGELVHHKTLRQAPSHEQTEDNTAKGHDPQGCNIVERIEETTAEEGTEVGQHTKAEHTQGGQQH